MKLFPYSVQELDRWCTELRLSLNRLLKEINLLHTEKAVTESHLDALSIPLSLVNECLTIRDARTHGEITVDDANTELKRELNLIENNAKLLRDQCQRAWEQLNRLNDIKVKLKNELLYKEEARVCDDQQRSLSINLLDISMKIDPMRNAKK